MKKHLQFTSVFILILMTFTSCQVVEGIFKLGMGVGIFIVIAIVVLVVYIVSRFGKKG